MALPLKYNVRNVFIRWRATLATVLGIALVVAVYIMVQSLAVGLEKSSGNTGDPRNLMIVRKGSTAESSSQITREQILMFQHLPQIATDAQRRPMLSADLVVLISLPRSDNSGEANVLVRGITPKGMELRPQVSLVEGRWFTPGKREAVVSTKLGRRFANCQVGQTFKTGAHSLTVVGQMDGGSSAFDSEIWIDADEARSIFNREHYSSVLARIDDPAAAREFMARMEQDKRLPLRIDYETQYYSEQTRTAKPIKLIGNFLAIAMSIGAVFAGMNTMYASVGARTREIGTLRVLGYRRRTILLSFIIEGAILAAVGGVIGCLLSLFLHGRTTATLSFETFSETIFQFSITPRLALEGMIFAICLGIVGSLLPAIRASRLPVIAALKSV